MVSTMHYSRSQNTHLPCFEGKSESCTEKCLFYPQIQKEHHPLLRFYFALCSHTFVSAE